MASIIRTARAEIIIMIIDGKKKVRPRQAHTVTLEMHKLPLVAHVAQCWRKWTNSKICYESSSATTTTKNAYRFHNVMIRGCRVSVIPKKTSDCA